MNGHHDFANSTSAYAEFGEQDSQLKYYLQSFKLPDVSSSPIIYRRRGEELRVPGDSRIQDEIPITFICDEELKVYTDLYDKFESARKDGLSDEIFKIFVTDSMSNPILQFNFYHVFITSVIAPTYDTKTNETELFVDIILQFSGFDFTRLKEIKQ